MSMELIDRIRDGVIGDRRGIQTPFGTKPLVYADYTASGRSLDFVEDLIRDQVLPLYANTHSESSYTGAQTTALREQARTIIRRAVGGSDDDQVIFCGAGATAAINKLIDILNLRLPADLAERHALLSAIPLDQRPIVFIGPYEHHSNELPWRESIARVKVVPLDASGQLDIAALEQMLKDYGDTQLLIGSFSAASNVTGIKTDVEGVTRLLKQHGALSFWDYAAAAPYVKISMNEERADPVDDSRLSSSQSSNSGSYKKDAVFLSPHKFVGGPGTPGVLIVKKQVLKNSVPAVPGGGTVSFVSPERHRFIDDHQRREEGGTPAIVEAIRAGLVFRLQQEVGLAAIEARESAFIKRAIASWQSHANIDVLGNTEAERLAIASLRIKHGEGKNRKDLHYGFVVALLNDLFGIQARGGCSCAGPYGHALLQMDMHTSRKLETQIQQGQMILRPGWVRLNFNYFISEETVEYFIEAVKLIAAHGWRLLPYYCYDKTSGTWRYQDSKQDVELDLHALSFSDLLLSDPGYSVADANSQPLSEPLRYFLQQAEAELTRDRTVGTYELKMPAEAESLRWFILPQEVQPISLLSTAC